MAELMAGWPFAYQSFNPGALENATALVDSAPVMMSAFASPAAEWTNKVYGPATTEHFPSSSDTVPPAVAFATYPR